MSTSCTQLLGTRIDALSWEQTLGRILRWAQSGSSRIVCLCNVHSLVSARSDAALARALAGADLNAPDGAPVAWLMRRRGWPEQQRLSGPDMMWKVLQEAQRLQLPVYLFGGSPHTLERLQARVRSAFPSLPVAGALSPPFRSWSDEEEQAMLDEIRDSGARIVLVSLGCPKQEKWMAAQRGKLSAVMLGVGAAFDYHAGVIARAPAGWQRAGFEWLYRLLQEPARLASRYLLTNTLFLLSLPRELWRRPSG